MVVSRVLVLGGGFAGMFAARQLERRIGWFAEIELINDVNYFVFQPLLPEVAAGGISAQDAVSPLRQLLPGVRVRQARVFDVDISQKTAIIFQGQQRRYTEVNYDHLIVALGQTTNLSHVPGLQEHALPMKTLSDALALRNHVIDKLEHADITQLPDVKKQLLTFTVVGAGFSGIETAGEVKDLIDQSLKYYTNIDPAEIRVIILEFGTRVLPELPKTLATYAQKRLERRGIEIFLGVGVKEATGTHVILSDDRVIGTRTTIATIGNAPSEVAQKLNLPQQNGKICVERTLQVQGHDDIWALGDAALIPMTDSPKARSDFAPPTAQFAVREAQTLAANVEAVLNRASPKPFIYKSKGALASLGSNRGVAEIFGVKLTGFLAWVFWRSYYLSFVPGFSTKLRIAVTWLMDTMISRNIVQIKAGAVSGLRQVRFRAGDRVFEHGNRADGFYTVLDGAFELTIKDDLGKVVSQRTITKGGHFGERVILGENLRTGSVRALEDSLALVLGASDFKNMANAFPALRNYFADDMRNGSTSENTATQQAGL